STRGNLVPSLATDSALTYAQFPMSSFFEIGPLCCAQAPEAPNNINTAKAAVIDLFMVSPSPDSLYPLPHPRHEPLHPAHHAREVAAFHHLHHFLHLLELVEQAIDFLHRHARTDWQGNSGFAGAMEKSKQKPREGHRPRGVGAKPSLRMRSDGVSTTARRTPRCRRWGIRRPPPWRKVRW